MVETKISNKNKNVYKMVNRKIFQKLTNIIYIY